MNISNMNSEILIFLVGQLGVFIWWASKMNTKLGDLIDTVKAMQLDGKESIAAIWKKFDSMKERIEELEKQCLIHHSHSREGDNK
jgi:hypothetical protein